MVVLANTTHPMQLVERAVATSDQVEGSIAGPGGGVLVFEISDPTAPQSEIVESIAFLVAASLGGVPQCNALVAANGPGVVPMSLMHGQVAADAIAAELTDRAGMAYRSPTGGAWADSPLAYGLADLSDVDFESWIDTHREEISECSLSELDSP